MTSENMATNKGKLEPSFQKKLEDNAKAQGVEVSFDSETIKQVKDSDVPKILATILFALQDLENRVLKLEQANKAPKPEVKDL